MAGRYRPRMVDDPDIWRKANLLVKRHGDDAALAAARRADELWLPVIRRAARSGSVSSRPSGSSLSHETVQRWAGKLGVSAMPVLSDAELQIVAEVVSEMARLRGRAFAKNTNGY